MHPKFLWRGLVALGAAELGPFSQRARCGQPRRALLPNLPKKRRHTHRAWACQLHKLIDAMEVGERVITFDRANGWYLVRTVPSEYQWAPESIPGMSHIRRVSWTHSAPWATLSVPAEQPASQSGALLCPAAMRRGTAHSATPTHEHAALGASSVPVDRPHAGHQFGLPGSPVATLDLLCTEQPVHYRQ